MKMVIAKPDIPVGLNEQLLGLAGYDEIKNIFSPFCPQAIYCRNNEEVEAVKEYLGDMPFLTVEVQPIKMGESYLDYMMYPDNRKNFVTEFDEFCDRLQDIVDDNIADGKAFSKYDITKELRRIEKYKTVKHDNIKEYVSDIIDEAIQSQSGYAGCVYDQTTVTRNGKAFVVYHPNMVDAESYQVKSDKSVSDKPKNKPACVTSDGFRVRIGTEGRIVIPKKLVQKHVPNYVRSVGIRMNPNGHVVTWNPTAMSGKKVRMTGHGSIRYNTGMTGCSEAVIKPDTEGFTISFI